LNVDYFVVFLTDADKETRSVATVLAQVKSSIKEEALKADKLSAANTDYLAFHKQIQEQRAEEEIEKEKHTQAQNRLVVRLNKFLKRAVGNLMALFGNSGDAEIGRQRSLVFAYGVIVAVVAVLVYACYLASTATKVAE
jgi:hypothetical protein